MIRLYRDDNGAACIEGVAPLVTLHATETMGHDWSDVTEATDLALSILHGAGVPMDSAIRWAFAFREEVLFPIPHGGGEIPNSEVDAWVASRRGIEPHRSPGVETLCPIRRPIGESHTRGRSKSVRQVRPSAIQEGDEAA